MIGCSLLAAFFACALPATLQPANTPEVKPAKAAGTTGAKAAEPLVLARSNREFLPSLHGFAFRNDFTGSPLPSQLQGLGIESLVDAPSSHGKCGGMSAAAADYFLSYSARPTATTPPRPGTPLYTYIASRQFDSLGPFAIEAARFIELMTLPDRLPRAALPTLNKPRVPDTSSRSVDQGLALPASGAGAPRSAAAATAPHIEPLLQRLSRGELIPLGLVYVAAPALTSTKGANPQTVDLAEAPTGMPWNNHQVLAFEGRRVEGAVNTDPSQSYVEIRIYDPNFPRRDDITIRIHPLAAPDQPDSPPQVRCTQHIGKNRTILVRALFPMPYIRKAPPPSASRTTAQPPAAK